MGTLIFTIIFATAAIVLFITSISLKAKYKISCAEVKKANAECGRGRDYYGEPSILPHMFTGISAGVALILAVIIIMCGIIVKVNPDEISLVYDIDGTTTQLHTGYNIVPVLASRKTLSTKTYQQRFTEGESADDIYGAQTSEKDYIQIVANLTYRVDPARVEDYINKYGEQYVDNATLTSTLKTVSRTAIERVISEKTTAEVMGNKSAVNSSAYAVFVEAVKDMPIIVDTFNIEDLVAPASYEQTIIAQAELRQKTQTAELQKTLNETEAAANKIKAEGEAQVAEVNAQNTKKVAEINAEKEKAVAIANAEKEAESLRIKTENQNNLLKATAAAEAEKVKIAAEASAEAVTLAGKAEAEVAQALANIYKTNPEMYELKVAEINADIAKAWAEKWSGYDLSGISPSISYANIGELLKGLITE